MTLGVKKDNLRMIFKLLKRYSRIPPEQKSHFSSKKAALLEFGTPTVSARSKKSKNKYKK